MDTLARQLGNHGHDRRDDIALPHGMLSHPLDVLEDPEVASIIAAGVSVVIPPEPQIV